VERKAIYERQEKLRANLGALQPTGQEATLRNRILTSWSKARISLQGVERRIAALTEEMVQAEERVNEIIAGLG